MRKTCASDILVSSLVSDSNAHVVCSSVSEINYATAHTRAHGAPLYTSLQNGIRRNEFSTNFLSNKNMCNFNSLRPENPVVQPVSEWNHTTIRFFFSFFLDWKSCSVLGSRTLCVAYTCIPSVSHTLPVHLVSSYISISDGTAWLKLFFETMRSPTEQHWRMERVVWRILHQLITPKRSLAPLTRPRLVSWLVFNWFILYSE